MITNRWVYGLVSIISIVSLVTAGAFLSAEDGSDDDQIEFRPIDSSGIPERRPNEKEVIFINSAEEYEKYIGEIPDDINIDFQEQTVIAVLLGSRKTGGYNVEVQEIMEEEDKLVINAQETRPGESCIVTMAITYPYDAVLVEKMEDEPNVELNISVNVRECD
ncbi:MAG: protease complex subunit PrcB family protein [Thermoplasmatota archaeon]